MTEFTVTGIRYRMGEHLSYEERGAAAEKFVASLKIGQPVVLAFEPDNPGSPNKAIAVYIDYERIGYIADEECDLVYQLLNEQHMGQGEVVRTDGHVTFFISIPGSAEKLKARPHKRKLPESPLGDSFRMPFSKEESALQVIAGILTEKETSKENLPEILKLTNHYVPLVKASICNEDNLWRRTILRKLEHLLNDRKKLEISDDDAAELERLCKLIRDAVCDMHRSAENWPEKVFVEHLDRLRNDESINKHLYNKYCATFLDGESFDEADSNTIALEHERLSNWLESMKWSELRDPEDLQSMGYRVNYLGLSRIELYDLYSVILLIEKLDAHLTHKAVSRSEIVDELTPIFWGEEKEADKFLTSIQGMKPIQITELVKKLVDYNLISEMSKGRRLWKVLHDNGLYKPSESNWNQQLK